MTAEQELREKLRKIEALFAGAATPDDDVVRLRDGRLLHALSDPA